jgi:hypothetical protein
VPNTTRPLQVQDVLSVFTDSDRSASVPTAHVLIQLLTADGLLILKAPKLMARELGESLSRASLEDKPRSQSPLSHHPI